MSPGLGVLLKGVVLALTAATGAGLGRLAWDQRQRRAAAQRALAWQAAEAGARGARAWLRDWRAQAQSGLAAALPLAWRSRLEAWLAAQPQAPPLGDLLLRSVGWGAAGALAGWGVDGGALGMGLACLAGLPWLGLREAAQARQRALRRALPDALDLLTACVQAGLGLDQALQRVSRQLPAGPLRQEWERSLEQLRAGALRRAALLELEQRCGLPEFGPILRAILRSEARGVALAPVLQAQARQLRRLRSLRLQTQAARAPVQMLFPLMVFFLPAVFLVVFGPILLQLSQIGF